jgi:hypothetical protein
MEIDDIYDYVEELEEEECENGKYYLGTIYKPHEGTDFDLLLELRIHPKVFFKYPIDLLEEYAYPYNKNVYFTDKIDIVQLRIVDDRYFVIIKTFWLRMFQRLWRERQRRIQAIRKNPMKYLDSIQRTGSYLSKVIKYRN